MRKNFILNRFYREKKNILLKGYCLLKVYSREENYFLNQFRREEKYILKANYCEEYYLLNRFHREGITS